MGEAGLLVATGAGGVRGCSAAAMAATPEMSSAKPSTGPVSCTTWVTARLLRLRWEVSGKLQACFGFEEPTRRATPAV